MLFNTNWHVLCITIKLLMAIFSFLCTHFKNIFQSCCTLELNKKESVLNILTYWADFFLVNINYVKSKEFYG